MTDRAAVQLKREDYENYDYLIGMDGWNIRNMLRILGGDPEGKVYKLLAFAGEERDVQFTVLSGRHSVLERPLSAAKRPLILTDCR